MELLWDEWEWNNIFQRVEGGLMLRSNVSMFGGSACCLAWVSWLDVLRGGEFPQDK